MQYLTLSGDNGGSQPALGVNTQIAEGMAWSSRQNAMTSNAKPVPGAWMLAWNQGLGDMRSVWRWHGIAFRQMRPRVRRILMVPSVGR